MVIFKCVLLCVGFFSGIRLCYGAKAQRYGRCNETYFLTKAFGCERQFFKTLATKDEIVNCSEIYNRQVNQCYNHTLIACFQGLYENWRTTVNTALFMLEAFNEAKLFCGSKSHIKKKIDPALKKYLPCKDEYFEEGENCTKKFMTMLKQNRKNPMLCRTFDEAFNCTFQASKTHCTKQVELPEDVKLENPFCKKELTTTTPHPYTSRDTTDGTTYGDGSKTGDSSVNVQAYGSAVQQGLTRHAWVMIFLLDVLIGCLL